MTFRLGNKIKELRRAKGISQEVLANYLGVSPQAVSKWENEIAMPDVTLIPAIASFFEISTDELFDYNLWEVEKRVGRIVDEYSRYYDTDRTKAERILRAGLKKYPGNDTLLNCLIGCIPISERADEVIELCKSLISGTNQDDTKYDAYRILAEAYHAKGEYELAKAAIDGIPELYFTKLEVQALLLNGEDMFEAAVRQKSVSLTHLIEMLERLADYYDEQGDAAYARCQRMIACRVIEAFKEDIPTAYAPSQYEKWKAHLTELKKQTIHPPKQLCEYSGSTE